MINLWSLYNLKQLILHSYSYDSENWIFVSKNVVYSLENISRPFVWKDKKVRRLLLMKQHKKQ